MRTFRFLLHPVLVLAGTLVAAGDGRAAPVPPPRALKAETVAAWTKAGAEFGYIRPDEDGVVRFHADDFKADCTDLPAFAVTWPDLPYCARLPEPEVPFALSVYPHPFDYTGKKPPAKEPPPGLQDIDVSNLVRVRRLTLNGGTEVEAGRLLNGLQRLRQLESLELAMSTKFLTALADGPALPNLRTLSVTCGPTEEQFRAVGRLKQLTHLRLAHGPRIDPKGPGARGHLIGLRHLAGLPALRSVHLDWCNVLTDEELPELAKVPDLRELSLTRCEGITAKGLNALAGARKLESLDVAEGPATDGGWTEAGKLTALRWLRIGGPAVTDAGLGRIAAIPGLRELTLKSCDQVTDAGFARLAAHRKLEALGLWFCPNLGEQGTKAIGGLTGLRHLRTGYCPGVTDGRLDHWAGLADLRELDLRGCPDLTDAGVAKLARFGKLEELHLWVCTGLTEKCLRTVAGFRELHTLEMHESKGVRPDDRDMAALAGLRHLRRLMLPNCRRVTADGYRALARLPGLDELGLVDCPELTDGALADLAAGKRLQLLILWMAPRVTDAGLRRLGPLPLRKFWVNGCERVTAEGIADFTRAHPRCDVDIKPNWKPPGERVKK